MPPAASRFCPCTIPFPSAAASSPSAVDAGRRRCCRSAARVGIRAAASPPSTLSARWCPMGSRPRPVTGPGSWPGGPATIGLATGHLFDVLDVDGPSGEQAIRTLAATQGLRSSGPLVRTGGGGWHYYLARTGLGNVQAQGLAHVDWRGRGGYVVAPPSRHASGHPYQWAPGRDLEVSPGEVPAVLLARLERRAPHRSPGPVELPLIADSPRDRYARAALAEELARVATAPVGHRNRQLWESTRNLYNLVATGALDPGEVDRGLLQATERNGLLGEEPRQTHRTLASGRQVGLAHPRRPPEHPNPNRTQPTALPAPPRREDRQRARQDRQEQR